MKQYVIDELRPDNHSKIKDYMDRHFGSSPVDGIYWIPLDVTILTDKQAEHEECQPYYFAVDLEQTLMACELLVRTKNRIRCDCIQYATEHQRNWLIRQIDTILQKLDIQT